jgi:hypothetical protein
MIITILTYILVLPLVLLSIAAITVLSTRIRPYAVGLSFALILTPAWAPATIAEIPLPLGVLITAGVFGGFLSDLVTLVEIHPVWYLVTMPSTFVIGFLVGLLLVKDENHGPAV